MKLTPWIFSQIYRDLPGIFHFLHRPPWNSNDFYYTPWNFQLISSIGGLQFLFGKVHCHIFMILNPNSLHFFIQSDNDLTVYENIVSTDGYNAAQQSAKAAFMESASRQSQRMCLGLLSGEDAVHVKLTLATIQSVKLSFQPSEANLTTLGCDSCTPKPAYVDFKALKTAWSVEYACGDATCTGACVASLQVYFLI